MNKNNLPIGIFDSGMGGLTVLRELKVALPQESFVYLGDTARLPYGTKSPDTIKRYALQMARTLVERQIKALVIACNTATTAALDHVQTMLPDIPVLGVVAPGAFAAVAATKNQQIVVLATETTINSEAYQHLISTQLPQAIINPKACSLLVAIAEEGFINHSIAKEALRYYLADFGQQDTLLLGCTHFPVFKQEIKLLLPSNVTIVDSAQATAKALVKLLTQSNLAVTPTRNVQRNITYLVTDSITRFQRVGELFLGESITHAQVELIHAGS